VRELWRAIASQRDALRGVRAEEEQTRASVLIQIAVALIGPWLWLAALDLLLRRVR